MDHVVDGAAVGGALVRGADENEFLVAGHFGTGLGGADAEELHDEKVELEDKLPDVLVLPHALVYIGWQFTDLNDVGRFIPDQLLQILLHRKRPVHL